MMLQKYKLSNSHGMSVEFINFGGIVTKMMVPDHEKILANVVLGFVDETEYLKHNPPYYNALVGRFANRIGGAKFSIDGMTYPLFKNDGANALHGGKKGFDKVFWKVEEIKKAESYKLTYLSPDMEEGYPGNLKVEVIYSLNEENEFSIHYSATTDKVTHVNLTHHGYFNLSSDSNSTILDHELTIDADHYSVSDDLSIPTGEIRKADGPVDFRKMKTVGEDIKSFKDGYNHNYILNHPDGKSVVATLCDPKSGRVMEVITTEPGLQLYTGYYLDQCYSGLALEAQHYPDSPNKNHFPSTLLKPGQTYRQATIYRFRQI
jgi:aldose 1-epimerase